jgi:hypothetical protein
MRLEQAKEAGNHRPETIRKGVIYDILELEGLDNSSVTVSEVEHRIDLLIIIRLEKQAKYKNVTT